MRDLEVFVKCDSCSARSQEIWTKVIDGVIWPLSFCSHHADKNVIALQAQGFNPLESEALTR